MDFKENMKPHPHIFARAGYIIMYSERAARVSDDVYYSTRTTLETAAREEGDACVG